MSEDNERHSSLQKEKGPMESERERESGSESVGITKKKKQNIIVINNYFHYYCYYWRGESSSSSSSSSNVKAALGREFFHLWILTIDSEHPTDLEPVLGGWHFSVDCTHNSQRTAAWSETWLGNLWCHERWLAPNLKFSDKVGLVIFLSAYLHYHTFTRWISNIYMFLIAFIYIYGWMILHYWHRELTVGNLAKMTTAQSEFSLN